MWYNINKMRPGGMAKLRKHITTYKRLWQHFKKAASQGIEQGGIVINEWPRSCRYWRDKDVVAFFEHYNMSYVDFDGCMVGLTSAKGVPIKKPWRIATNCNEIIEALSNLKCNGSHKHCPCAGSETKKTEGYRHALRRSFTRHSVRRARMPHTLLLLQLSNPTSNQSSSAAPPAPLLFADTLAKCWARQPQGLQQKQPSQPCPLCPRMSHLSTGILTSVKRPRRCRSSSVQWDTWPSREAHSQAMTFTSSTPRWFKLRTS